MTRRSAGRIVALALLGLGLTVSAGCNTFWTNRRLDAQDVFEIGVTQSDESQFALYLGVTHGFMIGQTSLRGKLHGLANGVWGTHEIVDDSWGWGFLGEDVHEVGTGISVPMSDLPKYDTGILGLGFGRTAGLKKGLNSPLMVHFGWGGVMSNLKGAELFDFIVGFFGADPLEDDTGQRPLPQQ